MDTGRTAKSDDDHKEGRFIASTERKIGLWSPLNDVIRNFGVSSMEKSETPSSPAVEKGPERLGEVIREAANAESQSSLTSLTESASESTRNGSNEMQEMESVVKGVKDEYEEEEDYEEEESFGPPRTAKLLVAGGVAGVISRTATAPLDRLKMLLQVNDAERRMTIKEGIKRMAGEGTVRAFFKGNGTNVIKIAPETAIKLTTNDIYKRIVASDPEEITPPQRMVAGAMAGATAQIIIYPLELVKTRLAICPHGTYSGILDCARKVWIQEGWRSFYRGLAPSMMGILPYAGVDITAFELLKEHLLDQYDGMPPAHFILGAGMLSSSLAQFSAYPLALVRTRLQAQGIGGTTSKYAGTVDVLKKTFGKEGFRGLYKVCAQGEVS